MEKLVDILNNDPFLKTKTFKKGEIVQYAGDVSATPICVKEGLLRSYIIDSKGKEHIYMFAPEGWIIGDIEAMEYEQPIQLYIDCIENAEVIYFPKDYIFKSDLAKDQVAESVQLLYRSIGRLQRRVLMLMGAPAIDRYKYFMEIYPELSNRVPQHMIASFLGVAPQTLSTIRGKMARSS